MFEKLTPWKIIAPIHMIRASNIRGDNAVCVMKFVLINYITIAIRTITQNRATFAAWHADVQARWQLQSAYASVLSAIYTRPVRAAQ